MNVNNITVKQESLSVINQIITDNLEIVIKKIEKELFFVFIKNHHYLNPKKFYILIKDQIEAFLAFLKTNELQWVALNGAKASEKGLAENIIYSLFSILKAFFNDHFDSEPFTKEKHDLQILSLNMVDKYKDTYISSYHKQHFKQGISGEAVCA